LLVERCLHQLVRLACGYTKLLEPVFSFERRGFSLKRI